MKVILLLSNLRKNKNLSFRSVWVVFPGGKVSRHVAPSQPLTASSQQGSQHGRSFADALRSLAKNAEEDKVIERVSPSTVPKVGRAYGDMKLDLVRGRSCKIIKLALVGERILSTVESANCCRKVKSA